MTSFRDARNLLMLSYDDGLIDDDEFILLYDANMSKNPEFPYEEYGRFDLDEMDDTECKAEFRFRKTDIPLLAEALRIPEKFTCSQGTTSDGIEGLCMVLKRLSYPCRYSDLIPRFGWPVPIGQYRLHLRRTQPQNNPMEQHDSRSCKPGNICECYF